MCESTSWIYQKQRKTKKSTSSPTCTDIKSQSILLMEELDPYPVLKSMNQHGLLNENQVNWILKKKPIGRETAVKELISLLKWMDQSDFDMFLTILQQGSQSYIYEHLTKQHDLVALRKTMNDNLDVIADAMDGKTLRNLYLKVQGLAVHDRRNYKQLISKIINDFNEDNTLIFADSLHASGLELLVKEDKNEKSKFEKKQRYKKVFNELFEKSLTKECIPDGLPKVSSMVHKDGKIYLTLNPENIYQINDFLDYCESKEIQNDMANWIFGKEKQRSMCIQECNDNFGVSVKDIGLDVETSEMDCDIAKSWLNKTKGLFTQSENYKMNLPPTYKRLLKDPLMTPSDVSKFLESKEKMLWLNTFAAKKLERFDGKILNDIHRIVNRIYEDRCLTREHVFFCVDNDAEGFQVMYTKLDPEKRVKLQNVTLEVLIDEHMIMRIGDAQNEYEFKSGLLLDYLVATQEEKFIWDRLHIELFPYCIVFRSVDFLQFWIEQRDLAEADVLTEMIPEVIMMQGLDQFETDNEVISTLCKDGCFDVPCQLLDVATKYMINFLIKKNLLREVTMQTGGHSYPEEKTQNILKNKIAFQVYRNSPVLETFVLGHTSWINVLKMCQIVSVIGGGQVTIIINEDNELRCSVSLGCYRQGQGNVDEFSLEISNQTEKGLDIKMVSQICQSLHVMENLTVFKMVNTRLTTEFVNDIMSSFTKSNLLHLCFNGNDLIEINWSNLGSIPELEVFEMNGCKLFDQEMISLSTELSKLRYLEIIDVGNNNLTSEGIAALSKHLGKLRYLKALRLQKNILGENAVGYLADLLCRLPRIEIINLSGCELRNRNIRKLSQVLARKCVRKINLRENCISQNESAVLLRSLAKKSRYLQYLDYSRNVIGLPSKSDTKLQPSSGVISKSEKTIGTSIDDSTSELTPDPDLSLQKILKTNVESLLPSLSSKNESAEAALLDLLEKNSSCVSYLCLWECGLGYTNIFANIKNTTFLTNLTSLCLQNNELNDDFAETIGVCMRNSWHSLQHLNLNHNSISDRGVHALFEGLRLNIALEELLLRGNKVEKKRTVLKLFRSVTTPEHKNMKTFDICLNAVSEPDREYLNQRMMRMCDMMSVRYKDDGKVTCMKRQNIQVKF
ncbi:hypothetical protein KUTeg_008256 [Tegillarca granosa]|uniref:CARD domain-containing protein n=1 Tax=Tegillarca granosa TaxID=220873 RepID=A0ABQ9FDI5_TEGGR|nr:hypothetical protein KUTeg_008256 [Tegillarca granosa]